LLQYEARDVRQRYRVGIRSRTIGAEQGGRDPIVGREYLHPADCGRVDIEVGYPTRAAILAKNEIAIALFCRFDEARTKRRAAIGTVARIVSAQSLLRKLLPSFPPSAFSSLRTVSFCLRA
jgi:hypothetical protein